MRQSLLWHKHAHCECDLLAIHLEDFQMRVCDMFLGNPQAGIAALTLETEPVFDIDEVDDDECSPLHLAILKGISHTQ